MTTLIIRENSPEAKKFIEFAKTLPFVEESRDEDEEEFERIPGLPYTKEERIASVRRSMEDIRAGRVYSAKEVRAMFPRI